MTLTFECSLRILKAVSIYSTLEQPPKSKKLAGYPPKLTNKYYKMKLHLLMISILAMARPAPLTRQPISPSKATQFKPASTAFFSWMSTFQLLIDDSFNYNSSFYLKPAFQSMYILPFIIFMSIMRKIINYLMRVTVYTKKPVSGSFSPRVYF